MKFTRHCYVCQCNKSDNVASLGLLKPLPLSYSVFTDISMDFITSLPKSKGKVIFVVVARLAKYSHFMALSHPFNLAIMVEVFLKNVYKLHGMPNRMVSDRDSVYLSNIFAGFFLQSIPNFKTNY